MGQRSTHVTCSVIGIVTLIIAIVMSFILCLPTAGHAAEQPTTGSDPVVDDEPDELQQLIESTGVAYRTAVNEREAIELEIADLEAHIAELEEQLPVAQDAAADSIYILYRFQLNSNGLVELLLSADDFNTFITMLEYLENISAFSTENLIELNDLVTDLKETEQALNDALEAMNEKEEETQQALADAQAARAEKERQALQLAAEEAAARTTDENTDASDAGSMTDSETSVGSDDLDATGTDEAEETESAASELTDDAQTEEPAASDDPLTDDAVMEEPDAEEPAAEEPVFEEPAYEEPVYEEPVYEEPVYEEPVYEEPVYEEPVYEEPAVEETTPAVSERDAFIAEWGSRINNYLAGSPLAGYGETFAAAAWDYDVDPRWSPAIAYVESTLGRYCNVGSYNAWGWDHTSWGSWEEGIYAHVQGLANGYGYTLTEAAAQKYCPPSWQDWYNKVSTQMSRI